MTPKSTIGPEPRRDSLAAPEALPESLGSGSDAFSRLEGMMRAVRPSVRVDPDKFPVGRELVDGRIRLGRKLGKGSMGTVYEATDQGRPVALKILDGVQASHVYRLKTEFRRLSELMHPNVICVYELFSEQGEWFFSMERVHGLPLNRHIELRYTPAPKGAGIGFDEGELRGLLRALIEGIAAIHGAGLVHRDLKPHNVMVRDDGRPVILDFGLVTEDRVGGVGQTLADRISGTLGYMAPEQLLGGPVSRAGDWYAVGAILYQLLTGRMPRTAPDVTRDGAIAPRPLPPSRVVRHRIAPDLEALAMRLLAADPSARPTADEMMALSSGWPSVELATAPPLTTLPGERPFIGREAELAALHQAFERTRTGTASIVLLDGPCGTGKTTLLHRFTSDVRARGAVVLEGRCSEWESVPYKGIDGMVDAFSRVLLRMPAEQAVQFVPRHASAVACLFPALLRVEAFREAAEAGREVDEQLLRRQAFVGTKDMIYRLAERHPVVVVLDDLQWADADSMRLLAEFLCGPDAPGMLLVASLRSEDARPEELSALLCAPNTIAVPLAPFTDQESRALAIALSARKSAPSDAVLSWVVRESRGMPLYIAELVQELEGSEPRPELLSMRQLLLERIERLTDDTRALLELIAVAVRPVTLPIASACGVPHVQTSLRQLLARRLVRTMALAGNGTGFEPYTEQVRRVVMRAIPDERVTARHAALAKALETLPAVDPQWLLAHYRGAGDHQRAKRYAILAADRALAALAFEHAGSLYLTALECSSEHEPDWVALNVCCADTFAKAGRGAEAVRAYLRAARTALPDERARLRTLAVSQMIRCGYLDEGIELLRETIRDVGLTWPESERSAQWMLITNRMKVRLRGLHYVVRPESEVPPELLRKLDALHPAQTALGAFDHLRGATFAAVTLPLALRAGEPKRLVVALASESVYSAMLDGEDGEARASAVHRQIDELQRSGTGPYERGLWHMARAMCSYWMGHWKDVSAAAERADSIFRHEVVGASWESCLVRSIRHTVLLHTGRIGDLAEELPDELKYFSASEARCNYLDLLRRSIALHLARDDVTMARSTLEELARLRAEYPFIALDHLIMSSVVSFHLYCGDVERAQYELRERWVHCKRLGMDRLPMVRLTVLAMESDCTLFDARLSDAARITRLRHLAKLAAKQRIAWAGALAHLLQGAAHELIGDPSYGAVKLRRAIDIFDQCGMSGPSAVACMHLARLLTPTSPTPGAAASLAVVDLEERVRAYFTKVPIARPESWARLAHSLY
ncbi:serine/threonine-protein kinase PknK [Pendulispora albinea]|uniref:AAA family ATPase n=1 Tax=Pendulispora albinea TaxID=2741071 RepID=A0ABZ2LY84_9BACT